MLSNTPRRPAKQWTADELPGPRVPLQVCAPRARPIISVPKHVYLRSEPYKRWVASLDCAHCFKGGPTQAAHSDAGADGKGKSIKADDSTCFPACADDLGRRGCHSILGSTGLFTREQQQTLAASYARLTQEAALEQGKWPKEWPLPAWTKEAA